LYTSPYVPSPTYRENNSLGISFQQFLVQNIRTEYNGVGYLVYDLVHVNTSLAPITSIFCHRTGSHLQDHNIVLKDIKKSLQDSVHEVNIDNRIADLIYSSVGLLDY
jgi:hypothetical protein